MRARIRIEIEGKSMKDGTKATNFVRVESQ
jgi:hypothetical protein